MAEEQQRLTTMVASLSETEKQEVYRKGLELLEEQNSTESADCLPTVLISGWLVCEMCMGVTPPCVDVERVGPVTLLDHYHSGGIPVQYTEQPTNGLTYFRATSHLGLVPDKLKIFTPLFSNVITK